MRKLILSGIFSLGYAYAANKAVADLNYENNIINSVDRYMCETIDVDIKLHKTS